ncbi:MAG: tetratricopeptide repeat protein [Flavobacteriaceae bacterium]|nr:tetratricopeptide repeat protein [Flavobacteriaceae bacterium]
MKTKLLIITISLLQLCLSCSRNVNFSQEFIDKTSGRYLYTQDEILTVYYEKNTLFLNWRGAERLKPVVLDQNTIFVADMYKKLRFVEHPDTEEFYLATVDPEDEDLISYDYLKLADSAKIPSRHLLDGEFDKALSGYMKIKANDSTDILIDEGEFNRLGYQYLREKRYQNAIDVFKINVALYPESSNVYDSLADAYLRSGDSLQAFNNYSKALELNNGNRRAKEYVEAYQNK